MVRLSGRATKMRGPLVHFPHEFESVPRVRQADVRCPASAISCWDAKYFFELWRPITAIRLASTDGNADTEEQGD
jgi:hypothetical protein